MNKYRCLFSLFILTIFNLPFLRGENEMNALSLRYSEATKDLLDINTSKLDEVASHTHPVILSFDKETDSNALLNLDAPTIAEQVADKDDFEILDGTLDKKNNSVTVGVKSTDGVGHAASWLSGSWGITFPIYGGERLDSEIAGGYDYLAGAQQVIDSLPAVGHVITNLSNFAKSYYFTLRGNVNVDIATEIDESFVPSQENEAIILEALQMFKSAGKRNILYISTNYFDRLDDDTHALWETYYTNKFGGDEYAAYRDLVQGFILRIKDYADGYWLDTTSDLYEDGYLEDFVQMIRDADPDAIMGAQPEGLYFTDEKGEYIKVDSDGIDDEDDRDYKIIKFDANCTYQDFTKGHITPLGQGAPPNSWAYEEFTIPAMEGDPWPIFEGNTVLKHGWFPMREKWHVSSYPIVFGTEDAYRFAKRLVDANAAITFATTINDVGNGKGYMMPDEMHIMKTVNDRLLSNPIPDYEPYVRPEGAYLVGEDTSVSPTNTSELMFHPNPVVDELTITGLSPETTTIKIISMLGANVFESTWRDSLLSKHLNLSHLEAGMYIVNLTSGQNKNYTRKIIISK